MREDDDALAAAAEYAVQKNCNRAKPARQTPEEKAAEKAAIDKAAKEAAKQIVLLNQVMPNGKLMRHCTGAEMEQFGDAYKAIAHAVSLGLGVTETITPVQGVQVEPIAPIIDGTSE
jgi:hypothetical protein